MLTDVPRVLTDRDFIPDCTRIVADIIDSKEGKTTRKEMVYASWEIDGKRLRMADLRKELDMGFWHRKQIILTFIDGGTGNQAIYTNRVRPWEDHGGGKGRQFRFELSYQANDLVYRRK